MRLIRSAADLARAFASSMDEQLKSLIATRRDQLVGDTDGMYDLDDLVHFMVVEPPDTIPEIEAAANFPIITSPSFEWVLDHGQWLEAVTVLSDDGFGIALFVPLGAAVDPAILCAIRNQLAS